MKTKQVFLGIDVGTSSIKGILATSEGETICVNEVQQVVSNPYPNWSEQDPEVWWRNTIDVIKCLTFDASKLPYPIEISCIGITGQMHSSVFLDSSGKNIRPSILWNDSRTTLQCQQIYDLVGKKYLQKEIGNLALEGFTAPKLLWLKHMEPDNYLKVDKMIMPKDYIRYRLTGELATDHSDASGTIFYDVRNLKWSKPFIDILDIPFDIFPEIYQSTDITGFITTNIAKRIGLKEGIPVVCGGADNAVGAISSGVLSKGQIQSSIGTSGTLLSPLSKPLITDDMNLHVFNHCSIDTWYAMGTVLSAGNCLRWLRDNFAPTKSFDSLINLSEQIAPGSDRLIFLPYLSGERTPHNDPNAKGVFFGLHNGHTLGHMTKSVLEGVTFALKDCFNLIKTLGFTSNTITGIGGGNKSHQWRQIQSDVLGIPVSTISPSGGPSYGAAMLASVGYGHFNTPYDCVEQWLTQTESNQPNLLNNEQYEHIYEIFRSLYPNLKESFKLLE